jgi:hypothetical protein
VGVGEVQPKVPPFSKGGLTGIFSERHETACINLP